MGGYIGSRASVVSSGAERKKHFAITTTTTSLTGLTYTPTMVHVYHNGIRLVDGTDFTATDGSTITLTNAAENGDDVVVVSFATFQTSDTVSKSAGGAFGGDVTVSGDVGIGTTSSSTYGGKLNVIDGAVGGETTLVVANNNANQFIRIGVNDNVAQIAYDNADSLAFGEATDSTTSGLTTERMRIDSAGRVTMPYQPAFHAKRNGNTSWQNSTFSFATELFDTGNNYNGTKFTAPVAGKYYFALQLTILGGTTGQDDTMYWHFYKNGSAYQTMQDNWSYRLGSAGNGVELNCAASSIIDLAVNDYVDFRTSGLSHTGGVVHSSSHFMGYLIG